MSQPPPVPALAMTRGELAWLTAGAWVGGVCLLTLVPVLLMPRFGPAAGVTVSYLLFFVTWQPLKTITERALGVRGAFMRMLALVATAAAVAYYLREALLGLLRAAG